VTQTVIDAIEEQPGQASGDATVARPPDLGGEELDRIFSVDEFEPLAAARMGTAAYDFVRGWAGTGWTARNNLLAFRRWVFRPRVLVDVTEIDSGTTVLGTPVSVPILFAPTAMQRLAHPLGELATARAAKSLDTVQVLSSGSSVSLEDVAAAGPKRWFQLDWLADRDVTQRLLDRAVAAGFGAIVLTVDSPIVGWREGAPGQLEAWPAGVEPANLPPGGSPFDWEPISWRSIRWLRAACPLPLVLKGIVRADDARLAVEHGADAIVVSNHGGRQIDGEIATLDALPGVVDALSSAGAGPRGRPVEVYMDGGVRRGTDVLKAIALGARAVLIGRPVQWGLAAGGEAGIVRMMELMSGEFRSALGLCGATRVTEVTRAMVTRNPDAAAGRP
jgi:4-hydroxymandelate oxidase